MAPSTSLNPLARPFVPVATSQSVYQGDSDASEDHITQEELEELELAEEWVNTMAVIEEMECEHLIELALRFAPKSKLNEIQNRFSMAKSMRGPKKGAKRHGGGAM